MSRTTQGVLMAFVIVLAIAAVMLVANAVKGTSPPPGAGQPMPEDFALGPAVDDDTAQPAGATAFEPPAGSDAEEMVKQYVLASFPNWSAKVVAHDGDWRSATVRVRSAEDGLALDVELVWDGELGDYVISRVRRAKSSTAAARPAVPDGVRDAISGHPRLGRLGQVAIEAKKITSSDALVVLRATEGTWRVYLKRRGNVWAIINARKLGK